MDTSRIQHYSPSNSPSSSSTTRRYKETYTSKSTLKHTHHQSSKWNDRRQSSSAVSPSSPSLSSSKHRTSSSEINKSFHHDNDVSPVHKKLKKHKKHSKHKHKKLQWINLLLAYVYPVWIVSILPVSHKNFKEKWMEASSRIKDACLSFNLELVKLMSLHSKVHIHS
ncbi:unnamed protein product [Schistosoma mattheei]|uniref:Uncharacterized protein n=1 Tax=Schistosoma mattheei TaxID=31246 RepID=A0A3P7YNM0_9TREM|nr:unnamed protein product [Schistosoma mattheei]